VIHLFYPSPSSEREHQIFLAGNEESGVAEAEFEADIRTALRKLYYSCCGDAPRNGLFEHKPADARLLDGLVDPDPFPA